MFFLSSFPVSESAFDLISLFFLTVLLLLSFLSLSSIFYLCIKSRTSHHLQRFNSLWTVRVLFVVFVTLWAINELIRLPFRRWRDFFPFLPNLSLHQQGNLCKFNAVVSLGLFEPGFLVTLLFLVNVSVKKTSPRCSYAIAFVFSSCLPVFIIQLFVVFFSGLEFHLPEIFQTSSQVVKTQTGEKIVTCAFPFLATVVFGAFGLFYSISFLVSCWRVLSLVINKALRIRIYALGFTVLMTLTVQILFLGLSVLWSPDKQAFMLSSTVILLTTVTCAAVGEGILVIKPIADSLAAGGDSPQWRQNSSLSARSSQDEESGSGKPDEIVA